MHRCIDFSTKLSNGPPGKYFSIRACTIFILDMIRKALDILPIPIAIFTAAPSINNITFLTYIYIYVLLIGYNKQNFKP